MEIINKRPDELRGYERNARTHSKDQVKQIAASITAFGFNNPILIDGSGMVIAGHGRLAASIDLGRDTVPCVVLDHLSDAEKRAYILADNKLAALAGWDDDLLRLELGELKGDVDIELIGFDADELAALMNVQVVEGLTDEDEVPNAPEDPVTKLGDVWILGNHRLMCGDSTSIDAVERLMDGQKADMVFTDPPYGVAYKGKTKDALEIKNDNVTPDELKDLVAQWFNIVDLASRDGAYLLATVPPGPLHLIFAQDWVDRGWLRQIMVWNKSCMVMGHSEYHYKHEPILFGWKPGKRLKCPDRTKTTVWDFAKPSANREHPTMKPVEMWEYGICNHSRYGDIIFEPFGGSGTAIIACEKNGRLCRTVELDPKYCDVIVTRWENFTGKRATHAATGRPFGE
jgi:DNA modification methylase